MVEEDEPLEGEIVVLCAVFDGDEEPLEGEIVVLCAVLEGEGELVGGKVVVLWAVLDGDEPGEVTDGDCAALEPDGEHGEPFD